MTTPRPNCPVCSTDVESTDTHYTCPSCAITFHDECWHENQGCATYGCPKVGTLKPPPIQIMPGPVHAPPNTGLPSDSFPPQGTDSLGSEFFRAISDFCCGFLGWAPISSQNSDSLPPPMASHGMPPHVAQPGPMVSHPSTGLPSSPVTKKNSSFLTVIVGCVVFFVLLGLLLPAVKDDLPISISFRDSYVGNGLVLIVTNQSDQDLSLQIQCVNFEANNKKTYTITVPAQQTKEFGWMELNGWRFEPGEEITLSHPDYRPFTRRVP